MKHLTLLILTLISLNVYAQFVRVYDLKGSKISKGQISLITDTALQLKNHTDIIPFSEIGFIKTKHSFGHNSLVGGIIGAGIFGIATAVSYSAGSFLDPGLEALGAAVFGFFSGTIIGAITNVFKKTETIEINGDLNKWEKYVQKVTEKKMTQKLSNVK